MFSYAQALKFVLRWEGGFVDDPDDRGGRTNKGVTQATYDAWRSGRSLSSKDVLYITDGEVADIYQSMYWKGARCDRLRDKMAFCQFDTAVNMGPRRAVRILQRATECEEDGVFGAATQAACDGCDIDSALLAYTEIRATYYHMFAMKPGQGKFLKGWMNRLNSLRKALGFPATETMSGEVSETTARIPDLAEGEALDEN
ncbi:hypothetical protein K1W69_14575 [Hoeflea sp. WL0058]|uniref:Secretion activator protein n=1 Tax=Flavimaribacter sediminis TaxID=2865987 RepID=A0AAE2ZKC8_9HYPH|nr:glycosyl hydrolase 108 family protein [Flavimaribacter sediminis]MBW8638419.1 hypothetical protein [Flavimaribacter sediminis]